MGITRQNWFEIKGDETLALDWPLDENSHVWEIGGYEGRWAQQIWDKFHCNITIFEPQIWAQEKLKARFSRIEKIDIRLYGLWTEDANLSLGDYFTDGASVMKNDTKEQHLAPFENFYNEQDLRVPGRHVDVCLMNIEGAEFILLPEFIKSGYITRLHNFWCQFHPGLIEDGELMYQEICAGMEKTHEMIWDCYPTAVAWRKR